MVKDKSLKSNQMLLKSYIRIKKANFKLQVLIKSKWGKDLVRFFTKGKCVVVPKIPKGVSMRHGRTEDQKSTRITIQSIRGSVGVRSDHFLKCLLQELKITTTKKGLQKELKWYGKEKGK